MNKSCDEGNIEDRSPGAKSPEKLMQPTTQSYMGLSMALGPAISNHLVSGRVAGGLQMKSNQTLKAVAKNMVQSSPGSSDGLPTP